MTIKHLSSNNDGEFRGKVNVKLENLEKLNEEFNADIKILAEKQKNVEDYKNIIDRQDKRIEDINTQITFSSEKTSWLAAIVGLLTLVIGVGGVAFPYMVYKQNKEIQEEAKENIKQWKESTKKEFDNELENFKSHTSKAKREVDQEKNKIIQEILTKSSTNFERSEFGLLPEESKIISKESNNIAEKAEVEKDIEGLLDSARLSFYIGNFGDALRSLDLALSLLKEKKDINDEYIAKIFYNKGIVLGRIGEFEKEIEAYDSLLQRFEHTTNETINVHLSIALNNKGIAFWQMGENQKAIDIYNELLEKYRNTNNELIQEQIARALNSKGVALLRMGENQKAINVFNELLSKFKDAKNEAIKESITLGLKNKQIVLRKLEK